MSDQTKIYITDQRGALEQGGARIYSTLNYDSYQLPHRESIGSLLHVNEWQRYNAGQYSIQARAGTIVLIIPLASNPRVAVTEQSWHTPVGELLLLPISQDSTINIHCD